MAVGLTIKTYGLFESNDDKLYSGVTGMTFAGDLSTLALVAAGTSNFGATATIAMTQIRRLEILPSTTQFPGDTPSDRP